MKNIWGEKWKAHLCIIKIINIKIIMSKLYWKLDDDTWMSIDGTEEFSWTSVLYFVVGMTVACTCIGLGIWFLELFLSLFD